MFSVVLVRPSAHRRMRGPYVTITHDALSLTVQGPLQLSPLYITHGTPSPDPRPRCPRYQTWEPLVPSPPDIIHGTLSIMVLTYGMRSWKAGGKHPTGMLSC